VNAVCEDFRSFESLSERWNTYVLDSAALEPTGQTLRFVNANTTSRQITNAQIDDYQKLHRRRFRWRPPLTMTVRARFSHPEGELRGTAGFGFWNDPFMMTGKRAPTLPRAIWFFYASPPSNMKLDLHVPGCGWKAAMIDALRLPALLLAPVAPVAVPLMNIRPFYHALWPIVQRALGVREAPIQVDMTAWHTYVLEWERGFARFQVDEESVLQCDTAPRGPQGFVMWFDNQYVVVTPWGKLRYGWIAAPGRQWMEVDALSIEPGN
jgi:hypothetical protein